MEQERVAVTAIREELAKLKREFERLRHSVCDYPRLHRKDVAHRYGINVCTLWRWVKEGRLPRPMRYSAPMWRKCDLDRHDARSQRKAGRRQRAAGYRVNRQRPERPEGCKLPQRGTCAGCPQRLACPVLI